MANIVVQMSDFPDPQKVNETVDRYSSQWTNLISVFIYTNSHE